MAAMDLRTRAIRIAKSGLFLSPFWRIFLPVMKLDKSVAQIHFITQALASVSAEGSVLEIGVGGGATSILLNKFMDEQSIIRPFYAIDTFAGFTPEDVAVEKEKRRKTESYDGYRSNRRDWYLKTMRAHGLDRVAAIESDAKNVDYSQFSPIAFCFLDVDLYNPIKTVLPNLYKCLSPGGMIIVDDCAEKVSIYDGAGEAYREFCSENGMRPIIECDVLGIIRKPD